VLFPNEEALDILMTVVLFNLDSVDELRALFEADLEEPDGLPGPHREREVQFVFLHTVHN